MPVSPARGAAFDILLRVECEDSYASELLHSTAYRNLSPADHALATELVMGALRWRSRLDDEIASSSSQPLSKLDLEILIALRLALYQFRSLDRIPPRAALHESVELVKRARKRSAAGFVNAVLRKLSTQAAASPDPPSSAQTLARVFAHPFWLVERWVQAFGFDIAHKICQYDQIVPDGAIRLRQTGSETEIAESGISVSDGRLLASARRIESGDVTKTPAFRDGRLVIQDEASQLVACLVGDDATSGERILDCCAAPGGKTLAIADHNPQAAIIAVELHLHRARLLQKLLRSHPRVKVVASDIQKIPIAAKFSRILADVPCSGTGTLAHNPEIKWRLTPDDLPDLRDRQVAILRAALAHAVPGARVIYSTCSLEKEENEDVIEAVLSESSSFRVVDCRTELDRLKAAGELVWPSPADLMRGPYLRTIPGIHPCEGLFAAILERS
jgi:16S rRNA (cytosine967-C5)-methyltransferase